MSDVTFRKSMAEDIRSGYKAIFESNWPSWLAGIFLAILALLIFLWSVPWGIAGGYRNWGDWMLYAMHLSDTRPDLNPWLHSLSVTNFGLFAGALASALLSRQFSFRRAPALEYAKGAIGGILMGTGAVLASGCNVGGFYTAVGIFSMGGYAMMIGLGVGAFIGLRYLLWEMEHLPQKSGGTAPAKKAPKIDWSRKKPFIGGFILLLGIIAFYLYAAYGQAQMGGLLFFGILIGVVMHRSRFCFVRAFREPFMTGDATMVRAVAISLILYGLGSAVIKWSWIQPPDMGVFHPFWIGSLLGGLIFGVGMLIAGGCASSTLWRVGEGQSKLMITLISFALTNSIVNKLVDGIGIEALLGNGVFMPKLISWQVTVPVFMALIWAWVLWAAWNEKSEKFVIL